ncbi:hypothetical protein HY637_02400 [Candidatus Woesearchaeota archaeon]|nr:hypothetical protein [Candidatus Woesearchaeota archaeon]
MNKSIPPRRQFLKMAVSVGIGVGLMGLDGILAQSPSSEEINGFDQLMAYAKEIYESHYQNNASTIEEWLNNPRNIDGSWREPNISPSALVFDDYIDEKKVQLIVHENLVLSGRSNVYSFEMRVYGLDNKRELSLNPYWANEYEKRFLDNGLKGNLSGKSDFVERMLQDGQFAETDLWLGDGGYELQHLKKTEQEYTEDGGALYAPSGITYLRTGSPIINIDDVVGAVNVGTQPLLVGYYKSHSEIQTRHDSELQRANREYRAILPVIIDKLAQQGKIKITTKK